MSLNTILATTPLTSTGYHLKATGTTIGNSLIWDNGTNVGIGNTNTSYTLDVSGTGYFSGIVGIGVAPSAWYNSSGYATLQVGNASLFGRNSANSELYLSSNAYDNTSGNPTYITTDFAARYVQNDGVHSWLTAPSGTAGTATTFTERMRITQAGNVGIGTSTPDVKLDIVAGGDAIALALRMRSQDDYSFLQFKNFAGTQVISEIYSNRTAANVGSLIFTTNNGGVATERMRITSGGNVLVNTTSSLNGAKFEVLQNTNATNTITAHNNQASPYGLMIRYTAYSPNNSDNWFVTCEDSTTTRIKLQSNGGIGNYSGNNTNYSDIRLKDNIIPIESYWNKFKAIEIVKFKYKDQTHDDYYIGVIAQQVEEIAPEFVDLGEVNKTTPEDGIPIKSIYTEDLHHATIKVLQECMTKIEEQQIQIQSLQEQINILAK